RHTRFSRDWSSDVCSSDLHLGLGPARVLGELRAQVFLGVVQRVVHQRGVGARKRTAQMLQVGGNTCRQRGVHEVPSRTVSTESRSEERRVGKEWRRGGYT